jgi:hypothetical protein
LVALAVSLILLSGCAAGVSSPEKLACDALFESWEKVDFDETSNFNYLYLTSGVSRLGDNSESSTILVKNNRMATAIREAMELDDDDELRQLVNQHAIQWTRASNAGLNLMRSLIFTAKFGEEQLNDNQLSLMRKSSGGIIDAGNTAMKIRSRCVEIGYKQED